jgi:alcohol dehydrogenase (quinone), dehydrogenase subunit
MKKFTFVALLIFGFYSCTSNNKQRGITDQTLIHADEDPGSWLTYGLNYSETRFSKLNQVTDQNVKRPWIGLVF